MKEYIEPEVEIIEYSVIDIIAASTPQHEGGRPDFDANDPNDDGFFGSGNGGDGFP